MLRNILINAGRFTGIATAGNHVNVVLAAGEIEIRAELENGRTYSTPAVQGMAIELPRFKNIQVSGKTSQQTKIWVGEIPLSYSPDSARQVGSNALLSSVGYVYSGYPHELLPAEVGRNKITLTPAQDIFIGGSNLSEKNGVLLPAGQTFTMATQGAVFALENSGNYKPYFTVLPDVDRMLENVKNDNDGQPFTVYYENQARTRAWGFKRDRSASDIFEYDPRTKEYMENKVRFSANSSFRPDASTFFPITGDWVGCYGGSFCWQFNLSTGELLRFDPNQYAPTASIHGYEVAGEYHYVTNYEGEVLRALNQTDEWELYAAPPPYTNGTKWRVSGFAVFDNGSVVVTNESQLFYKRAGEEWVKGFQGDIPFGVSEGIRIDRAAGALYKLVDDGVEISYDLGDTWKTAFSRTERELPDRDPDAWMVVNGLIVVVAIEWVAIKNPITGEWKTRIFEFDQRNCYAVSVSPSGFIQWYQKPNNEDFHTALYSETLGEQVPVGGLPVSIMAEVN
jgi:hypothetical protein